MTTKVICRIGYAADNGQPFYRIVEFSPDMVRVYMKAVNDGLFKDAFGMVVSFEPLGMT